MALTLRIGSPAMVDDRMRWLAEEATNQLGNVTRQQSDVAGFTENERRGLIRGGVLERAGAHVLRSPFVERTALGDLTALVADYGPGAVASGPTGAAVYGWDGLSSSRRTTSRSDEAGS